MSEQDKQLALLDIGPASAAPEPPAYPSWYTPSKERHTANTNVVAGRHPMGHRLAEGRESCGTCLHIIRKQFGKTYLKCAVSRMTGGPATDVRAKWPACENWKGSTMRGPS